LQRPQKTTILPQFTPDGVLPPGTYDLTIAQLRRSMLVGGPEGTSEDWNRKLRRTLVDNLSRVVSVLRLAHIRPLYVDGSFVEDKNEPRDIDAYFECDRRAWAVGTIQTTLAQIGQPLGVPISWDKRLLETDPDTGVPHLPLWHALRVDLHAHWGQLAGIRDPHGYELTFPSLFRTRRDGTEKGILRIV